MIVRFGLSLLSALAFAGAWPVVIPFTQTARISDSASAHAVFMISGRSARPLYKLACYGSRAQPSGNDFEYDGDFECRLTAEDGQNSRYSTLLTEDPDQSRDWQSRARFFGSELVGDCGQIPEFGRVRDFSVRGMRIELRVSDPSFDLGGHLKSFTLCVSVTNDASPDAAGGIAASARIDQRWKESHCKLDNSVTPQFRERH